MMNKKIFNMLCSSIGLLAALLVMPGCNVFTPIQTPQLHTVDPYRENPRIVFRHIDTTTANGAVSIKQFSYDNGQKLASLDADLATVSFRQAYGDSLNNSFNSLQGTNTNNDVSLPNPPAVPGLTIPNPPPPGLIKALGNSATQPLPLPPHHNERIQKMLQQPIQAPALPPHSSQKGK